MLLPVTLTAANPESGGGGDGDGDTASRDKSDKKLLHPEIESCLITNYWHCACTCM